MNKFGFVLKFPEKCCVEVSRCGNSEPCDKPAVAVTVGAEAYELHWPICKSHIRGRELVPLSELLRAQDA